MMVSSLSDAGDLKDWEALQDKYLHFISQPLSSQYASIHASIFHAVDVSYQALAKDLQKLLELVGLLLVFQQASLAQGVVPIKLACAMLSAFFAKQKDLFSFTSRSTKQWLELFGLLQQKNLLRVDGESLWLHDLLRDYLEDRFHSWQSQVEPAEQDSTTTSTESKAVDVGAVLVSAPGDARHVELKTKEWSERATKTQRLIHLLGHRCPGTIGALQRPPAPLSNASPQPANSIRCFNLPDTTTSWYSNRGCSRAKSRS